MLFYGFRSTKPKKIRDQKSCHAPPRASNDASVHNLKLTRWRMPPSSYHAFPRATHFHALYLDPRLSCMTSWMTSADPIWPTWKSDPDPNRLKKKKREKILWPNGPLTLTKKSKFSKWTCPTQFFEYILILGPVSSFEAQKLCKLSKFQKVDFCTNFDQESKFSRMTYLAQFFTKIMILGSISSLRESSSMVRKISTNHKSVKLYGFKLLKPRKTSTTNLRRRRTHEEHEECEEQRISNKLIARDSLQFHFSNLQSIPQRNWRIFCVQVKITLPQIQSISLARRSNQRITFL